MKLLIGIALLLSLELGADQPVRLQFTNTPVEQTNELAIEMHQSLPGIKLDANSQEAFRAIVKLVGEDSYSPITQPPLELNYTLKEMKIDLNINGKPVRYHTSEPAASVEVAQLSKVIDKPIPLRFTEGFALDPKNKELQKLIQDYPVLDEINFDEVLRELFIYVFALAGKDLTVGSNFQVKFPADITSGVPIYLNYEITKIDDQAIQANMSGNIDVKGMKLENKLVLEGGKEEEAQMSLSGKITGTATWNRKDALIHQTDSQFVLKGNVKIAELEWPINVTGDIKIKSKPVSL